MEEEEAKTRRVISLLASLNRSDNDRYLNEGVSCVRFASMNHSIVHGFLHLGSNFVYNYP